MEAVKGWLEENERQNSAVFDEKLKSLRDYVAKMVPEYITFIEKEKEEMKKVLEESKNYKPPVSLKEKVFNFSLFLFFLKKFFFFFSFFSSFFFLSFFKIVSLHVFTLSRHNTSCSSSHRRTTASSADKGREADCRTKAERARKHTHQ